MGPRKDVGSYKASRVFNLLQTTLWLYAKDRQKSSSETIKTKLGRKQVLPCEAENDLAQHFHLMERKIFDLTMADVMHLAYLLAVRNGIKNQFLKRNYKTGRKWLKNFLRHHQEISVTTTEVLHSQEQGVSLLNQQLSIFKSKNMLCTPFNIILQDETCITIVQHKHTKILGLKGKCQISSVQSTEWGSLVTVVNSMIPNRHFILLLLVFTIKYMKPELMNGTPRLDHSTHFISRSGYRARISPSHFFISSNIKSQHNKIRSFYLSTGRALFTHKEPGGHYFSSRESC